MSSPKGFPTDQKKIIDQPGMTNKFVTVQPAADSRAQLDTIARASFRIGSQTVPRTVGANSTVNYINDTSTPASVGDFIRFQSGAANEFVEMAIVKADTNGFELGGSLETVPTTGDEFYILRYITPRTAEDGSQLVQITVAPVTTVDHESLTATGGAPITTTGWLEFVDALADDVSEIGIYNGTGKTLRLGVGAAAAEASVAIIPFGVYSTIKIVLAAGSRISLQAVEANTSVGVVAANFFGEV